MRHQIPHDLDAGLAKAVVTHAFESYRARFSEYNPRIDWTTERDAHIEFQVRGLKLSGGIHLIPRAIELELEVPFVFRLFKNKAIEIIEHEVRAWIAKAKAGDLGASASAASS